MYWVQDDVGIWFNIVIVMLILQLVNNVSLVNNDSVIIIEDSLVIISVLLNDVDVDGILDNISIIIGIVLASGNLVDNNDGIVIYMFLVNSYGSDYFIYSVWDNEVFSFNSVMVVISI